MKSCDPAGGGLSARELAAVLAELPAALAGARVRDVARLTDRDDLLLFFEGEAGRRALQIAPGGNRARLCTTRQRFPREELVQSPQVERLRRRLVGARLAGTEQEPGERCCRLRFDGEAPCALAIELFGPRGLWCLLDRDGTILELSRRPTTASRDLRPGAGYAPPPPRGTAPAEDGGRFPAPVCESVDRYFTELDREQADRSRRQRLRGALERARRGAQGRVEGLLRQREEIEAGPEIRRTADLLLAYASRARRGDAELVVPDPDRPGEALRLPLDPARPVHAQATALYRRARKLEDAAAVANRRLEEARSALAALDASLARLDAAEDAALEGLEAELIAAGQLRAPAPAAPPAAERKITGGEPFRRFTSAEGHPILVGRNNQQNDRLTLRVARGNDVWLHVGQGRAGSHVVVRVPRGKTASLETLLDAATLAIHFSRARGTPCCEVVYTQAKHVRKPKGLPPGQVLPAHTRTLTVRFEEARLRRLLGPAE